jgi:hypothetical protein
MAAWAGTYEARHRHLRNSCPGRFTVDAEGVGFESEKKKQHTWKIPYGEIQQMWVLDHGEVRVLTYQDRKWLLGKDKLHRFWVTDTEFVGQVTPELKQRLGRRLVAGRTEEVKPLWEVPVKHLLRFQGVDGVLAVAEDRIQFRTAKPGHSREWMLSDIDSISSAAPDQLTITTFERALGHYGDRKGFNFRLKEPLDSERYNQLWRRLESAKGLELLGRADEKPYER